MVDVMSKRKKHIQSVREQLTADCDELTHLLYGLTYEEYQAKHGQLPNIPQNRWKILLDMDDRILQDGWLHEQTTD